MFLNQAAPGFSVSESFIELICSSKRATEMLSLLTTNGSLGVPITETIVFSASSNKEEGTAVIKYLAELHQQALPVTERILIAPVKNEEQGDKVLEMLLRDASSDLVTDNVLEEACWNKEAMALLLERRKKDIPTERLMKGIAEGFDHSRGVLQLLLERNLVSADDLASNFYVLDVLLAWKPDIPITEKALIAGARDFHSMRLMLGVENGPPVTGYSGDRHVTIPWPAHIGNRSE
ncbi:hypothetical protein BDW62DRAFT_199106 [Aspergillus aurantiobrunneus]